MGFKRFSSIVVMVAMLCNIAVSGMVLAQGPGPRNADQAFVLNESEESPAPTLTPDPAQTEEPTATPQQTEEPPQTATPEPTVAPSPTPSPTPGGPTYSITVAVEASDTGLPLENADVVIYPAAPPPPNEHGVAAAHMGGGKYSAQGFPNGDYLIYVSCPGYLEYGNYDITIKKSDVDTSSAPIILQKDNSVTYGGIITDARGVALEGMDIDIETVDGTQSDYTYTDEDGRYSFLLDSTQSYLVTISQNGKVYKSDMPVENPSETDTADILLDGCYLTYVNLKDSDMNAAKMTDDGSVGERLFEVTVSGIPQPIVADAEGGFHFLGTTVQCVITVPSRGQFFAKTYAIQDCSAVTEPVVVVLQTITLKLVLKDESGDPVKTVSYSVANHNVGGSQSLVYEQSLVSASGEFQVRGLDADASEIWLSVTSDAYAAEEIKLIPTAPLHDVSMVLKKGRAVLAVKDTSSNIISDCSVITDNPDILVTGSAGSFVMSNIPVGKEFRISISKSEYATQIFRTVVTDSAQTALTCYFTMLANSTMGTLSGKVKDAQGAAVNKAIVRLGDLFTYTDADGKYTLTQAPVNRPLALSVEKTGYVSYTAAGAVTFTAGSLSTSLSDILLQKAYSLVINVKDQNSGLPISDARVIAPGAKRIYSDAPGRYVISGMQQGAHVVSVGAGGYLSRLETLGTDSESELFLTAADASRVNTICGYVRDDGGTPLAGATVTAGDQAALTGSDGYFSFAHVSDEVNVVTIFKSGYITEATAVSYSDSCFDADVLLKHLSPGAGQIELLVTDDSNAAVAGAHATLFYTDADGNRQEIHSDKGGSTSGAGLFKFTGLESGVAYQVRVDKAGYSVFEGSFKADSGIRHYARIAAAGTCTVTVKNSSGQPIEGAYCYVSKLDRYFKTDANGQAVIDSMLFDTIYDINVYRQGYRLSTIIKTATKTEPDLIADNVVLSQMPLGSASISGFVTDKNTGKPVEGAVVSYRISYSNTIDTITDRSGYYMLPCFTKGNDPVTLSVTKGGSSFSTNTVPLYAQNKLNLFVEKDSGTVTGTIVNSSGEPVGGVTVSSSGNTTTTLDDGTYTLKGISLQSQSVAIVLSKYGYMNQSLYVTLSRTKTSGVVDGVIKRKALVMVELQDYYTGSIISNAVVKLLPEGKTNLSKDGIDLVANSSQLFIKEVEEGNYTLSVKATGYKLSGAVPPVKVPDADGNSGSYLIRLIKVNNSDGGGGFGSGNGIISVATPSPTATPAPEATPYVWTAFEDMSDPNISWAADHVNELAEAGIVAKEANFRPYDNITREEFVKLLVTAFGFYSSTAQCSFTDVSPDAWYYSYVASAVNSLILVGYEDGSFGAGQNISRQDMATLSYRAAMIAGKQLPQINAGQQFSDQQQIAEYASTATAAMQRADIINGMGDGSFAPTSNATRAQAAKIINSLRKLP